jgi:CRP-like cAMP-binding protein
MVYLAGRISPHSGVDPDFGPSRPSWSPTSFLARLDPVSRDALLSAGHEVVSPARKHLLREGDTEGRMFVLLEGWVRVMTVSLEGHVQLLAVRSAGELVGELATLRGASRSATVVTLTPVRAVRLAASDLLTLLGERPSVGLALLADLAEKVVDAGRQLNLRATESAEERLVALLRRLMQDVGRPCDGGTVIDLSLSQEDLAGLIGASRESVARALCRLRADGVVSTQWRRIVVRDSAALA